METQVTGVNGELHNDVRATIQVCNKGAIGATIDGVTVRADGIAFHSLVLLLEVSSWTVAQSTSAELLTVSGTALPIAAGACLDIPVHFVLKETGQVTVRAVMKGSCTVAEATTEFFVGSNVVPPV